MTDRTFSVLFVCTGNSARSRFAEALQRDEAGARFEVFSAGTRRPGDAPRPAALEVLRGHGHDVSGLRPKSVEAFLGDGAPVFDFVFTVCDRAANKDCAARPGRPITGRWGVPDPVGAQGGEAERALACRQAYGALARRIRAFSSLPVAALDRVALQSAMDRIARGDHAADAAPA